MKSKTRCYFQYQKGAIKTAPPEKQPAAEPLFNTKKVRLKPRTGQHLGASGPLFNTKKVRLKPLDYWTLYGGSRIIIFNTKKVRLKHICAARPGYTIAVFNTKKVRLKLSGTVLAYGCRATFQYQKGAIKTDPLEA